MCIFYTFVSFTSLTLVCDIYMWIIGLCMYERSLYIYKKEISCFRQKIQYFNKPLRSVVVVKRDPRICDTFPFLSVLGI